MEICKWAFQFTCLVPAGYHWKKIKQWNIIDFLLCQVTPLEWGIPEISTPWLHLRCVCLYFGNAVLQGCYPTHYNLIVIWFGIIVWFFNTGENPEDGNFLCKIHWLKGFVLLLIGNYFRFKYFFFLTHQADTNMTIAVNILPPFKEGFLVIFVVNFVM